MGDEDLRALERAAASDEGARLRWAEALLRAGKPQACLQALAPLLGLVNELGAAARRRALAAAVAASDLDVAQSCAAQAAALDAPAALATLIRETPTRFVAARVVLVRALRAKDKRAAQALARDLVGDPLHAILAAEGEIVI